MLRSTVKNDSASSVQPQNALTHTRFSPSASHRWLNCAGSVDANATLAATTAEPSIYAVEGTAAHELLEMAYLIGVDPEEFIGRKISDALIEVTEDMAHAVGYALDYVHELEAEIFTEHRVKIGPMIGVPHEDLSGTSDIIAVNPKMLWAIDYKHGSGVKVAAKENPQLRLYAAGKLHEVQRRKGKVILTVIQPRAYKKTPIDEWETTAQHTIQWMHDVVKPAIAAANAPNAKRTAGEWCRWCAAAGTCKAYRDRAMKNVVAEFEPFIMRKIDDMTPAEIGKVLDEAEIIERWMQELRQHALRFLLHNGKIKGWTLGETRTNRQWITDERKVQLAMRKLGLTEEEYISRSMISPAQAETLLRARGIIPRKKRNQPPPPNPLQKLIQYGTPMPKLEKVEQETKPKKVASR